MIKEVADVMRRTIEPGRALRLAAAQAEQIVLLIKSGWTQTEAAEYVREAALSDTR